MAKLSFKVYLENEDPYVRTNQVRRFCIDADVATNFLYLREKLQTIFPELRGRNFTVTWKDDEDEIITISTNEELEIALDEMSKNDIHKLYITLQPNRELDSSKIDKILHPGVICDVCDKHIRGYRFKCMQCPDYDLCTDCMTLGNHSDHYMIRMTEPVDWSDYHGRRLAHHIRSFMTKAANRKGEERVYHHKIKRSNCPIFNATASDKCHIHKRSKEQHKEPTAEAATEATEDPQEEATRHIFSQLLKIFENNISNITQFLDPLGINAAVLAEGNSAKNAKTADYSQTTTNAQKSENHAATSTKEGRPKKADGWKPYEANLQGKKQHDDITDTTDEQAAQASTDDAASIDIAAAIAAATTAAATAAAAAAAANAATTAATTAAVTATTAAVTSATTTTVTTTTSTEQATEADEWTMVQPESLNISHTSSSSSSSSIGTTPKQITPSAPAPPAEPEKTSPQNNIYPSLPEEVRKEFYHPNPKIQQAVEMMMAMGFTNEGGWLTHLLVSKNGDIDKALDVLQPVRHH